MFDYPCQTCGAGTVRATHVRNHRTRIKGKVHVIPDAVVGICDKCGAKHYNAAERKRWQGLAEHAERTKARKVRAA